MRVVDLIRTATEHLGHKGFENARLEVEVLLGSVLELDRVGLYCQFDRPVEDGELERFRELYRRRLAHEPLQYITGYTGFRDLDVLTDKRALIPRPETEELVQRAVDFLAGRESPLVADLGTGTGVIGLSIAYELPAARIVAIDSSGEALLLAEENARAFGLLERVELVHGDMLDMLEGRGPFDAIVSNPPYVRSADIGGLQPEISGYEPRDALDGGADGMRLLDRLAETAHTCLVAGGLLLVECGGEQAEETARLLQETGAYTRVGVHTDLAGRQRMVGGIRA